ncbi:MAG: hypothetical protein RIS29_2194 [Bacteroidota bacterium]|jgi:hypothetical protein
METNPAYYQLSSKVQLEEINEHQIAIRKVIKSRIIQKDAIKIVEMARQIQQVDSQLKVSLICSRNICSKSIDLLAKEGIGICYVE